jgi:RHS repeat-associated protein
MNRPHPSDGQAMGQYRQQYVYDEVGNILEMIHRGTDPVNPGWSRSYDYEEESLIEPGQGNQPGKQSNRLSRTTLTGAGPQPISEPYTHDAHGNMTDMPHLPVMVWDFQDQLQKTARQVVNSGTPETTYYVYDAAGERVRKVTERQAGAGQAPTRLKERIYLGGFEIYREYNGNGSVVTLERETLHVMDDQQRIALVETRTKGQDNSPQQLIRYQLGNHLGSVSLELDAQGRVISYEEYFPYGSSSFHARQTDTPKRYRYTGKERDEETGLHYHGARYYASWLGRWFAVDPSKNKFMKRTNSLRFNSSYSDDSFERHQGSYNLYLYVGNNPLIFTDPTGLRQVARVRSPLPEARGTGQEGISIPVNGVLVKPIADPLLAPYMPVIRGLPKPNPLRDPRIDPTPAERWWRSPEGKKARELMKPLEEYYAKTLLAELEVQNFYQRRRPKEKLDFQIDANVLIYAYGGYRPAQAALALLKTKGSSLFISPQVSREFLGGGMAARFLETGKAKQHGQIRDPQEIAKRRLFLIAMGISELSSHIETTSRYTTAVKVLQQRLPARHIKSGDIFVLAAAYSERHGFVTTEADLYKRVHDLIPIILISPPGKEWPFRN